MRRKILRLAMAATLTLSGQVPLATPARAYQVDCAILLCLAGGWPTSAPCAHARAVFIRRITPWPIEPPLQIWRCPMGASFSPTETLGPAERLFDAAFQATLPRQSFPEDAPVVEVQATDEADIDISGDAFDFVRSIRVYHIQYRQHENRDGDCNRSDSTRLGSDPTACRATIAGRHPARPRSRLPRSCGSRTAAAATSTARSSSTGVTTPETTAPKKSATDHFPARATPGLLIHLHRRLCIPDPEKRTTPDR